MNDRDDRQGSFDRQGSQDPSGIVCTVLAAMSGMERECTRDRTLEGHASARKCGKTIGGAGVTDESVLSVALHLRDQEPARHRRTTRHHDRRAEKGRPPSPANVMRMLREHDEHDERDEHDEHDEQAVTAAGT